MNRRQFRNKPNKWVGFQAKAAGIKVHTVLECSMKNRIIACNGSVQNVEEILKEIRDLYKIILEISVKSCIKIAAYRGAFIDQYQLFNIHVVERNNRKLVSIHFHGWKMGLKTGMYYLRMKPAVNKTC